MFQSDKNMRKNKSFWWFLKSTDELLLALEYDSTLTDEDKRKIMDLIQTNSFLSSILTGIISALFVLGFVMLFILRK